MPKRIMVTGATGQIGKAIALKLASDMDNTVIVIGRNREKCEAAVNHIKKTTGNSKVEYDLCDLSRRVFVEALYASTITAWPEGATLDVLVNNAAVTPRSRMVTPEGYEIQWATNVLGYYWMMETFIPLMSSGGRIVNVASYWAGGLDLDDPMFESRSYSNGEAYRASKQADRMITKAFAEKHPHLSINACHPGDVNSTLSNNLGFGGSESPGQGADTPTWLASASELTATSGKYFEHRNEVKCPFMENTKDVERLFQLCKTFDL